MREIRFRGKTLQGKWVKGFFVKDVDKTKKFSNLIFSGGFERDNDGGFKDHHYNWVDPATVGQFTGLKDSQGVEIYEGDICKVKLYESRIFTVIFTNGSFSLKCVRDCFELYSGHLVNSVVIGNIHDNPELMEVENDQ